MDDVRSKSSLFSDSDRCDLPSLAQGNLISFAIEDEVKGRSSEDRIPLSKPDIPCAQTVQDSHGTQTSPRVETNPS